MAIHTITYKRKASVEIDLDALNSAKTISEYYEMTKCNKLVYKTCSCGKQYTISGWKHLPFVGIQDFSAFGGKIFELRNCICNSTIAVEYKELK